LMAPIHNRMPVILPPEWEAHQLTLMSWPCRPETYVAADRGCGPESYAQAQPQQGAVANAVVEFEPVSAPLRVVHGGSLVRRRALHGWRREAFGEDALRLKRGELALVLDGARVRVVEVNRPNRADPLNRQGHSPRHRHSRRCRRGLRHRQGQRASRPARVIRWPGSRCWI